MPEPAKIKLPLTAARRGQQSYAKLLKRIDPRSRSPFAWEGCFFRPGTWITEAELWPDGSFPRTPLLLEYVGILKPARGWNSHKADTTVILWRYDRTGAKFTEAGRVAAPGAFWMQLMEPLVRDCFSRDGYGAAGRDLNLTRCRIVKCLAAELDTLSDPERSAVLTLVHDELASRIAEWSASERGEPLSLSHSQLSTYSNQ